MAYETLKFDAYKGAGGKGAYDKGVLTSPLPKWSEFYDEITRFRDYRDYVWRGQRCIGERWPLRSKFDRHKNLDKREQLLRKHLDEFRKAIRGRRGTNPPDLNEDDLWALGQHNGLATPMLDWTESPFVAVYFAFFKRAKDAEKNEGNRAVFGLNREIEKWYRESASSERENFIVFPKIEAHENVRFLAQSGVLTKALKGQDIKERVQKCYNETNHRNRIILVEILIPDRDREECLRDLNRMNINHASLFPDIYGSAIFCNLKLEIDG